MTINERFKEVRLALNKTQAEFGEQCGLGRPVIANIENNRSPVTQLYIKVVADNFGVSEEWLKSGKGSMFVQTKNEFVDELVERYNGSDVLKKVIEVFIELNSEERKAVLKFIENLDPEPAPALKIARSADDDKPDKFRVTSSEEQKAFDEQVDDSNLK